MANCIKTLGAHYGRPTKVLDQHTTYRGNAIPFLARVDCKIKISNANFSEIRKTIVLGIF
jgi:hypothetical protein